MSVHHQFSCGDVVNNRYQLDLRIHEGRWGDILKATDRKNGRPVAIRFFPSESEDGEANSFEKFSHLAQNLSKITAPGLGIPIDSGEVPGAFYTVYRWALGQTLEDRLGERGPLELDQIIAITESLLTMLSRTHSLRLPHGLIRPGKIVLDGLDEGNLHVSLVDFQVWRLYELATSEDAFDESKLSRRIIRYTGPEVVQNHQPLVSTDLYSLGLVILEMLQGTPYLDDNHRIALIARQLDAEPIDLSGFPIGPGFKAFLAQCLEKDPSDRFAGADEALELFQRERDRFDPSVEEDEGEEESIEETPASVDESQVSQSAEVAEQTTDVNEELFGREPSSVSPVSEAGAAEKQDPGEIDFDALDRDDLFGEEIDFGGGSDEERASKGESQRRQEDQKPKRTASTANRLTPNSSLIEESMSDVLDFDPSIVEGIPDATPQDIVVERREQVEDIEPTLVEAKRVKQRPTGGMASRPAPAASSMNMSMLGMVGLLVVALVGGIYFFVLNPGEELDGIQEDGEIAQAEVAAVYPLRITTNPPALRVQVQGHGSNLSPVEIRVREDEFPLRVRARMNAENIIETEVLEPTAEFHIDFDAQE